jgi:hypothetical protein
MGGQADNVFFIFDIEEAKVKVIMCQGGGGREYVRFARHGKGEPAFITLLRSHQQI